MLTIKYLERLKRINELIRSKSTGTPVELSQRLGISVGHLHRSINEIKEMGAPIDYCRRQKSYYYSKQFDLKVNYSIELITEEESQNINAGFLLKNTSLLFYESGGM